MVGIIPKIKRQSYYLLTNVWGLGHILLIIKTKDKR